MNIEALEAAETAALKRLNDAQREYDATRNALERAWAEWKRRRDASSLASDADV